MWTAFDDALPVLTSEYSFGPGTANALAVGIEGGLAVVSPPLRASAACFPGLERHGPVRALVASNAFHYLGIPEWKLRHPDATIYAPAQAIARVQRKTGLAPILPLSDLAKIAGPSADFIDMPHYRTGEVLVRMSTSRGRTWYLTDVVLNFDRVPGPLIARALFRVSGSAPGLRFNNIAPLFMVRDKPALKRWLAGELRRDAPRYLIPAHGAIVDCSAAGDEVERVFR